MSVTRARSLVLFGPSGCGKSTLKNRLLKDYPDKFGFSVSHTTRSSRPGETNGKEYHFTSRKAMQESINAGDFIEWAVYNGNLYGTSKAAVQDVLNTGKVCLLDIDMQGVISLKKTDMDCYYVFVKTPSIEELERRLRHRGSETEESLSRRLAIAAKELAYAKTITLQPVHQLSLKRFTRLSYRLQLFPPHIVRCLATPLALTYKIPARSSVGDWHYSAKYVVYIETSESHERHSHFCGGLQS